MRTYLIALLTTCSVLAGCANVQTSADTLPATERTFDRPQKEVYSAALASLMEMRWQISSSDREEGLITALTPATVFTKGDLVTVFVLESDKQTRVDVTSTSGQQYDWGKGQKNLAGFYRLLSSKLQ